MIICSNPVSSSRASRVARAAKSVPSCSLPRQSAAYDALVSRFSDGFEAVDLPDDALVGVDRAREGSDPAVDDLLHGADELVSGRGLKGGSGFAHPLSSGRFKAIRGMAQRFVACDREQSFLMPPDVREWLPADHRAWQPAAL